MARTSGIKPKAQKSAESSASQEFAGDLQRLAAQLSESDEASGDSGNLPPVHLWNPEFCGDMDMRIDRDGSWHYMGSPIGRKRLVRLFSRILRRDDDDCYYLVTPVEKIRITVDDAPFVAVLLDVEEPGRNQRLIFETNMGERVVAGPDHPIHVDIDSTTNEPSPYVHVRARLEALIARSVFYQLADLGAEEKVGEERLFGVRSCGQFFAIGSLDSEDR